MEIGEDGVLQLGTLYSLHLQWQRTQKQEEQ